MRKILVILVLLAFSLNVFAADEKVFKPSIKPDMTMYFNYGLDLDENTNLFELGRMYLGLKVKPTKNVTFRATLDVKYDGSVKGAYFKYAYAEVKKLIPMSKFIFGQQKTGLIDFNQKIWKYRELVKVPVDLAKLDTSADMGLAIDGKLPAGMGGFHVGFFAGEGYKKDTTEEDKAKAFSFRLNLTPLKTIKGLMLTGYYKLWASSVSGGDSTSMFGAILSLKCKMLTIAGEYFSKATGDAGAETVSSLYASFHAVPKLLDIFGRVDFNDHDTDVDFDLQTNLYVGLKYWIAKKTSMGLAYVRVAATDISHGLNLFFKQSF